MKALNLKTLCLAAVAAFFLTVNVQAQDSKMKKDTTKMSKMSKMDHKKSTKKMSKMSKMKKDTSKM